MKQFWNSLSRSKQIAAFVILCHFLLLFALSIHHLVTNRIAPKRPIAIRTIPLAPQPKWSMPKAAKRDPQQNLFSDRQPPSPTSTKPKTSSHPQKTKATSPRKAAPKIETAASFDAGVLAELSKSLDSIASSSASLPSKSSLSIPKSVEKKSIASVEHADDISYAETLILFLQNVLELPEIGEVKVLLEMRADGTLQHCEILETKSRQNADFLKRRLPELIFPCFNEAEAKNLTIVFRNAE